MTDGRRAVKVCYCWGGQDSERNCIAQEGMVLLRKNYFSHILSIHFCKFAELHLPIAKKKQFYH